MKNRRLALGAFLHPTGHHVAAWRHPAAQIDAGTNIDHYLDMARLAERGLFDFLFLADALACRHGDLAALSRWPQYMAYFEPTTLIAAMATVTTHLGFVATATTSFNEPYNIARRYASLDHISKGRAGWNMVTSSNQSEAQNFSRDAHFAHAERYERAEEFVQVVKGLWDSWDDDAFLRDRETGRYFDPARLHRLDHEGPHFRVRGPLNVARAPQGYPVLVQAGASDRGRDFAGRHAEIVFCAQSDMDAAAEFRADLRARAAQAGRDPDSIRIMPGLNPFVAATRAEAEADRDALTALIAPELGVEMLAAIVPEVELRDLDVERPIPLERLPEQTNASQSGLAELRRQTEAGRSLREIYTRHAAARGQNSICGTPTEIADHMQAWFEAGAADGFLIQPAVLPLGLERFVDLVVPELQRRNLMQTEYAPGTLRDRLDLPRPAGRYQSAGLRNAEGRI